MSKFFRLIDKILTYVFYTYFTMMTFLQTPTVSVNWIWVYSTICYLRANINNAYLNTLNIVNISTGRNNDPESLYKGYN